MQKIAYPANIDKAPFTLDNQDPSTKYGLPQEVVFCKRCVISNQRPNSAVEYKTARRLRSILMKKAFATRAVLPRKSIKRSIGKNASAS